MKEFVCILLILPLLSSNCRKENEDCHKAIKIKNESNQQVVLADQFKDNSAKERIINKYKPTSVFTTFSGK